MVNKVAWEARELRERPAEPTLPEAHRLYDTA